MTQRLLAAVLLALPLAAHAITPAYTEEEQLVAAMNQERVERGLRPLQINVELSLAASDRVRDMFEQHYFAHVAPDGTQPFVWLDRRGYDYREAGENLAVGYRGAASVVDGWMHSPGHRKNVLGADFEDVGVAIADESPKHGFRGPLVVALYGAAAPTRRRAVLPPASGVTPVIEITDDFRHGQRGWEAGFADYSPANDANGLMELESGLRTLPSELAINGTGYLLSGHNRSDDLFMFIAKKLGPADGIRPNQAYEASFTIVFASNVGGDGCGGIGGSPGESLYLKAGASGTAPRVELIDGYYRVNADKGNQSGGGTALSVAGTIANGTSDCPGPYRTVVKRHTHTSIVTANESGELWLIVGTDSGFEGKTTLYYESIGATLTPRATR